MRSYNQHKEGGNMKDENINYTRVMGCMWFGIGIALLSGQLQDFHNMDWGVVVGLLNLSIGSCMLGIKDVQANKDAPDSKSRTPL